MAQDPIVQGLEISRQLLTTIEAHIKSQILDTFLDRIPGVDIIGRNIEADLAKAEHAIYVAEQEIKAKIVGAIKAAVPDALSVLSSLTKSLDDHLTQLLSNIATTEDVLSSAIATAKKHAPELATWIYQEVAAGFGHTALNVLREIELQGTGGVDAMLDEVLKIPNLPPWLHTIVTEFRGRNAEWQALAIPALVVAAILAIVSAIEEPIKTVISQDFWSQYPTKVADAETIIQAGLRGIIDKEHAKTEIRKTGIDFEPFNWLWEVNKRRVDPPELTALLFRKELNDADYTREMERLGIPTEYSTLYRRSQIRLLGEDQIRNAFLRNIIPEQEHDRRLELYGYSAETAQYMRELYFFIPPVADLIHMGIRNVFNPEIVERFTLGGDYPQAFEDAAKQQGVSSEWAKKYWEAHWIMPGREAFFEMFQRTTDKPIDPHADTIELEDGSKVYNIMGRETLNLALRDIDTPPFYRDKLTQVAYRNLTRIDIRRLHKVGLLSKAQVERAYLDLGNTPAHARLLAEFVVRLNATTTKNQAQSLVTGLQRHVIQLFIQDKLSEDEATSTLAELQFTPEETDVFLQEAKLVRAAEFQAAVEGGIGKLYIAGMIPETDAIQRLRDADLPDDAIHTLMAKWNLAIEYRGGTEHIHRHRELTKSEVLQALADNIIDEKVAESMLEDLGYDKDGADAEIGLALYRASAATKRIQIDAIKASYINGVIEQLEASNRLDALSVSFERRDAYLAEWSLARETRTERIPLATLRDMVKGSYLTEEEGFAHLKRHRLNNEDATLLLKFWLAQPKPKGLVANV